MAAFDLDDESLDERQPEAFRTAARTLDGLADIAEGDLPSADWTAHEDDPQNITETETQFAETWREIKACVETHLERTALDESLDREPFAAVSISGYPPANQEMSLSVRYDQSGLLKVDIDEP